MWRPGVIVLVLATLTSAGRLPVHRQADPDIKTKHNDNPGATDKIVCYFPNWGVGQGHTVERVDPFLCTHIHFAFAHISGTDIITTSGSDNLYYVELGQLRLINPNLKIILTIGGYSMGGAPFVYVSSTPALREEFANKLVIYLRVHGLDGAELDWEYPRPMDKEPYAKLLQVIRNKFVLDALETGLDPLILSCAFSAGADKIENSYNLNKMQRYVEYANVMTYDMAGAWGYPPYPTGLHSALKGRNPHDQLSQEWVINRYIQKGFPRSKIVLGIPTYGKSFKLCDENDHAVGSMACGPGTAGSVTQEEGSLAYHEICRNQLFNNWNYNYEFQQHAVYAYGGDQWVSYDDVLSTTKKIQYAHDETLGGVMFWDLSKDAYRNQCGQGNYPLIRLAKQALEAPTAAPTTTTTTPRPPPTTTTTTTPRPPPTTTTTTTPRPPPTTTTTTTPRPPPTTTTSTTTQASTTIVTTTRRPTTTTSRAPTTTTQPSTEIECDFHGQYIRDPSDCSVFYLCQGTTPIHNECPAGLQFDLENKVCDWPENVDCP